MPCGPYRRRLPDVKGKIERSIPEVKRRNKYALLHTGGEPCLLYLPIGVKDDAEFDDVRQTYRKKDTKYELYLNRYVDSDGCRLYTNDTDRVPSILIAFPSNPDSQSLREEGYVSLNRMNAWTLWDPILPPKGAIIVRQTPGNTDEIYLLENVTHSWFPMADKTASHLLHQETPLTLLESGVPVKLEDLPTLEDTLALFKNDLTININPLVVLGTFNTTDDGTVLNAGATMRQNDNWLNNKVQFNFTPQGSGGEFYFTWGEWSDNTKPFFRIDRNANTVSIGMNSTTVIRQVSYTIADNVTHNVRAEISNGKAKLWVNQDLVLQANLFAHPSYNSLQPLTSDYFELGTVGIPVLLSNFYIMELI